MYQLIKITDVQSDQSVAFQSVGLNLNLDLEIMSLNPE